MKRPLIAVTTSEIRRAQTLSQIPAGEPLEHEMALGLTYARALEHAGAIPVVVPPIHRDAISQLLERVDGICMSGGPDIHPVAYGHAPHSELGPTAPDLDRFELELASQADQAGLPIFAICRGMQAINVARGGTLIQHLPEKEGLLAHRQSEPGRVPTHIVDLDPDSKLATEIGLTPVAVNTFHHQAIDVPGEGLVVTGRSEDGVIESVEDPDRPWLIGVQWHAELMIDRPEQMRLFERFVDAAREKP